MIRRSTQVPGGTAAPKPTIDSRTTHPLADPRSGQQHRALDPRPLAHPRPRLDRRPAAPAPRRPGSPPGEIHERRQSRSGQSARAQSSDRCRGTAAASPGRASARRRPPSRSVSPLVQQRRRRGRARCPSLAGAHPRQQLRGEDVGAGEDVAAAPPRPVPDRPAGRRGCAPRGRSPRRRRSAPGPAARPAAGSPGRRSPGAGGPACAAATGRGCRR